eukprot:403369275
MLVQCQGFQDITQEFPDILSKQLNDVYLIISDTHQIDQMKKIKLTTTMLDLKKFKYIRDMKLLILFGHNQFELFFIDENDSNANKIKFKSKLQISNIQASEEFQSDIIELEHSEYQELLRDKNNKIAKEDIEILSKFDAFKEEKICKVHLTQNQNILRLTIMTDQGYCYIFQIFLTINSSQKTSVVIEQLITQKLQVQENLECVTIKQITEDKQIAIIDGQVMKLQLNRLFNPKKQKFEFSLEQTNLKDLQCSNGLIQIDRNQDIRVLFEDPSTKKLIVNKINF